MLALFNISKAGKDAEKDSSNGGGDNNGDDGDHNDKEDNRNEDNDMDNSDDTTTINSNNNNENKNDMYNIESMTIRISGDTHDHILTPIVIITIFIAFLNSNNYH